MCGATEQGEEALHGQAHDGCRIALAGDGPALVEPLGEIVCASFAFPCVGVEVGVDLLVGDGTNGDGRGVCQQCASQCSCLDDRDTGDDIVGALAEGVDDAFGIVAIAWLPDDAAVF